MKFVIRTLPPSNNQLIRSHWAQRKRLRKLFAWEIKLAVLRAWEIKLAVLRMKRPLVAMIRLRQPGKMKVVVNVYRPRRLDYDNAVGGLKPLLDALKDVALIHDDSPEWLELELNQFTAKKADSLVEIVLEEAK